MTRRAAYLVLLLCLACGAPIAASAAAAWTGISGATGGWVIKPSATGESLVIHISGPPTGLKARPLLRLAVAPEAAAGDDQTLIVVYPADRGTRAVRAYTIKKLPGRETSLAESRVLPPLPGSGAVGSLTLTRRGPVVLIRDAAHGGESFALYVLEQNQWRPLPPPPEFLSGPDGQLVCQPPPDPSVTNPGSARILLALRAAPPGAPTAWNIDLHDRSWTSAALALPPGATLVPYNDSLIAIERSSSGSTTISLADSAGLRAGTTIPNLPDPAAALGIGDVIAFVSTGASADELRCRVVSPLGLEVYSGPLPTAGPVSSQEMVSLGLLLLSMFTSLGLWILRPARARAPISPPAGTTYAELGRRSAATALDLLPGIFIVELLTRAVSWVPTEALGPGPGIAVLLITILHGTIGEAFFGRTVGKAIMSCRTVRPDGSRSGFLRALARNAAKVICAPLAALHLAVPPWVWTHPCAFGTVIVTDSPDPAPPPQP